MNITILTVVLGTFSVFTLATPDFNRAEREIKFLNPSEVQEFPESVKTKLQKDNCLIPTIPGSQGPTGWARGSFAKRGQTDWAILCSNSSGKSEIKIIWGGKDKPCIESFTSSENRNYLQVQDTAGTITFSRMIGMLSADQVFSLLKKAKASLPSNFKHDCIVDAFVGKGSLIYFCSNGKWENVPGAD